MSSQATRNAALISLSALILALALLSPSSAWSHGAADSDVELHVGDAFKTCYFDLHPTLTQEEFHDFAGAIGAILRFKQLASAETLGRLNVDVGIAYSYAAIDDADDIWNDTFTHPDDEHYLGTTIAFPRPQFRVGVTDQVDVGAWFSFNPQSNFGLFGFESKIALLRGATPLDLAVRPHVSFLVGPEDLSVVNVSADLAVSRSFSGLAPYLGAGVSGTVAIEHADDVELDNAVSLDAVGFGGLELRWSHLSVGAQTEITTAGVPGFSARVSGTF